MYPIRWQDLLRKIFVFWPDLDAEGWRELLKGIVVVVVLGMLAAAMEINIEGPGGWARDLPCWRPSDKTAWYVHVWGVFMGGKEMDGYHLAAFPFWDFIFFVPFFFGAKFSWRAAAAAAMWAHLMATFEDFQWFVWNPYFGLTKFDAVHAVWHKVWWGPIPNDYPIMTARALFCSLFAPRGLRGGLVAVGLLVVTTGALAELSLALH